MVPPPEYWNISESKADSDTNFARPSRYQYRILTKNNVRSRESGFAEVKWWEKHNFAPHSLIPVGTVQPHCITLLPLLPFLSAVPSFVLLWLQSM